MGFATTWNSSSWSRRGLHPQLVAASEQGEVEREQRERRQCQEEQREGDVGLLIAEEAVADQPDHVVDRVELGQGLERVRQERRRVEDAAKEDQRLEHERLGERNVVELLGPHADQDAELREEEAREKERGDQDQR